MLCDKYFELNVSKYINLMGDDEPSPIGSFVQLLQSGPVVKVAWFNLHHIPLVQCNTVVTTNFLFPEKIGF